MNDIKWCIDYLKKYNHIDEKIVLPDDKALRALMNITMPIDLSDEFYERQDKAIQEIIKKNNLLYKEHKSFIDSWLKKNNYLSNFKKTHRKFEWQAGTSIESLYEGEPPNGENVRLPQPAAQSASFSFCAGPLCHPGGCACLSG